MKSVDGKKAIESALASAYGLPVYMKIMERLRISEDLTRDPDFQKTFNGFCRIRRNKEWRKNYYSIFQKYRYNDAVTFEEIFSSIYAVTGRMEASFSSKMLAFINPDRPIWDSRVLQYLGLKISGPDCADRQERIIDIYGQIEDAYSDYLQTGEASDNIRLFDKWLPSYRGISDVKKIDCFIWGMQEVLSGTAPGSTNNLPAH